VHHPHVILVLGKEMATKNVVQEAGVLSEEEVPGIDRARRNGPGEIEVRAMPLRGTLVWWAIGFRSHARWFFSSGDRSSLGSTARGKERRYFPATKAFRGLL
jgi:hypothetical protein